MLINTRKLNIFIVREPDIDTESITSSISICSYWLFFDKYVKLLFSNQNRFSGDLLKSPNGFLYLYKKDYLLCLWNILLNKKRK